MTEPDDGNPMPRLIRYAKVYEASINSHPFCGCRAEYQKRLWRKGIVIPIYCSEHYEDQEGVTE